MRTATASTIVLCQKRLTLSQNRPDFEHQENSFNSLRIYQPLRLPVLAGILGIGLRNCQKVPPSCWLVMVVALQSFHIIVAASVVRIFRSVNNGALFLLWCANKLKGTDTY